MYKTAVQSFVQCSSLAVPDRKNIPVFETLSSMTLRVILFLFGRSVELLFSFMPSGAKVTSEQLQTFYLPFASLVIFPLS